MDESEYERLEGVGVLGSMAAGAMAGTAEHLGMYPVDSVKVMCGSLVIKFVSFWLKFKVFFSIVCGHDSVKVMCGYWL